MTVVTAERIRENVQKDWQRIVEMLSQKVALHSVSAEGITGEHMKRSAEFVAAELIKVGVDARVVQAQNPDGSAGAFEVIGSKMVDQQAPTVLLYAHHDVQPAPDNGQWISDPFIAQERDGRLYGRGSADDGGGIAIHSGALQALGEDLKVNIKVFIEGEEEMGSPSFIPFIEAHRDEFASDVIIVADSGNWSWDVPSLTTSLRGNLDVDVTVKALEHPVHSGQFGGPILDANTLAAMLIASMYDNEGNFVVDGVKADKPIGGLQRDLDETQVRLDAGVVESYKFAGTGSLAERMWTKPSATIIGFDAHPVDGSFNVIADSARFRISLRTAPTQDPNEATQALSRFLHDHAPFGAQVTVQPVDAGMGWAMDASSVAVQDAEQAMEEAFGVPVVNKGEGGSIPFIPELKRIFPEAEVLVTGPEDPQTNAHSPNESISLKSLENNIVAEALLLDKLAHLKH